MENAPINQLIDHLINEHRNGLEHSEIRKILKENNVSDDQIKAIMRRIDNQIFLEEKAKSQNIKAKELIYIGLFITIIGLVVTIGTFTGLIDTGNSYILAYGPILGGIGFIITGMLKYKRL